MDIEADDDHVEFVERRTAQDICPDTALWDRFDRDEIEVVFTKRVRDRSVNCYVRSVDATVDVHYYNVEYFMDGDSRTRRTEEVRADFTLWVMTPRPKLRVIKIEYGGEILIAADLPALYHALDTLLDRDLEERDWLPDEAITLRVVTLPRAEIRANGALE